MRNIKLWVAASAVVGSAISYHSIYLFHICALLWLSFSSCSLLVGQKLVVQQAHLLYPIYAFVVYTLFSVLWHPDLVIWARYHFYLACGLITLFAVYQYVIDIKSLSKVFAVLVGFLLLNMFIGVLESLEVLRLPTSRYSLYVHYFGYSGKNLEGISEAAASVIATKPTGFNFNPNDFGFVLMLIAPFLLFYKSYLVKIIGLVIIFWLLLAIGSRTHFVAFILMLAMLPFFFRLSYGNAIMIMLAPLLLVFILVLPEFVGLSRGGNRMYSAFDSVILGLELMAAGDIQPGDSTSTRAYIYLFGITHLFNSYGLGLGFGGIQSLLTQYDFRIQAFHFFILQLLVDLGVFAFAFFMFFYLRLALVLRSISNKASDKILSYYAKSSSLALLLAIPASIAPSGVHYILTFYLLIGFALAVVKVYNVSR